MAADGGFASVAALPLLVEGSPIGVLSFHFTAPVNFDDSYRALLTSVAHHAAQAIDRARLYEGAQRAQADAEAANRSKDDFLSIVSHELRTPLSAVLGWATMLRGHVLDESRRAGAIEAIHRNATRQARLIDELLDVSRIVAGRAPLDSAGSRPRRQRARRDRDDHAAGGGEGVDDGGCADCPRCWSSPIRTASSRCSSTCSETR